MFACGHLEEAATDSCTYSEADDINLPCSSVGFDERGINGDDKLNLAEQQIPADRSTLTEASGDTDEADDDAASTDVDSGDDETMQTDDSSSSHSADGYNDFSDEGSADYYPGQHEVGMGVEHDEAVSTGLVMQLEYTAALSRYSSEEEELNEGD